MRNRTEIIKDIKKLQKFIQVASLENPMHMGEYQKQLEDLQNELSQTTEESFGEQFTTAGHDQLNPPRNPEVTEAGFNDVVGEWFEGLSYDEAKKVLHRASRGRTSWEEFYDEVTNLDTHHEELYWDDIPSDMKWYIERNIYSGEARATEDWDRDAYNLKYGGRGDGTHEPERGVCTNCGHDKSTHSSVDNICYGGDNCQCGISYPFVNKEWQSKYNSESKATEDWQKHLPVGQTIDGLECPICYTNIRFDGDVSPLSPLKEHLVDRHGMDMTSAHDLALQTAEDRKDYKWSHQKYESPFAQEDHLGIFQPLVDSFRKPKLPKLTVEEFGQMYDKLGSNERENMLAHIQADGASLEELRYDQLPLYVQTNLFYNHKTPTQHESKANEDFYEAGMVQPNDPRGWKVDRSDVKRTGHDIYMDMAVKDHIRKMNDPNFKGLTNQDYEDVYSSGYFGLRESKATEGIDEHGVLEYIKSNHPVNFRNIRKFNLNASLRETLNGILNKLQSLGYINEETKGWVPTRTSLGGTYNESKAVEGNREDFEQWWRTLDTSEKDDIIIKLGAYGSDANYIEDGDYNSNNRLYKYWYSNVRYGHDIPTPSRKRKTRWFNESKATELDWKKFTKDFFDLDKVHLDIHDLIEQQNTDAKIEDDESFQLPHIYNQAKQKVILDIEAKIRDLDQSDMDPLHIDMLKDELKREKEIALNELMHSEFDQMTDHNNPSFGITTALGDDGYGFRPIDRPWRTESKANEIKQELERITGVSSQGINVDDWGKLYEGYDNGYHWKFDCDICRADPYWENPSTGEGRGSQHALDHIKYDHNVEAGDTRRDIIGRESKSNEVMVSWDVDGSTDQYNSDAQFAALVPIFNGTMKASLRNTQDGSFSFMAEFKNERDAKDWIENLKGSADMSDDEIKNISMESKATEGGQGSGRYGHKQWMNQADRIENIKSEDLKREKFLTRARELYEQYAPDDEYLDMFKALKDD